MEELETKRGAITFLDVLGWKGIWAKNSDAIQTFNSLFEHALSERDRILREATSNFSNLRGKDEDDLLRIISISDTIVIISICDIQEALWLTSELVKKLMPYSIRRSMPLRGATTYGNFNYDFNGNTNLLVGPAVDEAASWHEATNWIGLHLTPSTQMLLEKEDFDLRFGWEEYCDIPFKQGRIRDVLALNWYPEWVLSSGGGKSAFAELNIAFEINGPMTPDISKYYINTLSYCKCLREKSISVLSELKRDRTPVKIKPCAKSFNTDTETYEIRGNDNWIVDNIRYNGPEISNNVTGHLKVIPWEFVNSVSVKEISISKQLGLKENEVNLLDI